MANSIRVTREDVERALVVAALPRDRIDAVWSALAEPALAEPVRRGREQPQRLDAPNAFFYLGGLVVILGLTYFAGIAWGSYGAGGVLAISLAYGAGFLFAARALLRRGWWVPGCLSVTAAVAIVPLAVYSLQAATGIWPDQDPGAFSGYHMFIRGGWVAMELATIAAAAIALRFVSFPFLVAPLAFSAWYLSMDLAPLLFGENVSDGQRATVSITAGLALIAASFALAERRGLRRHAFWGYLFGLAAYFGGTVFHCFETSDFLWWLTGASGILCLVIAVLLERRVFAVFGGAAIFAWTGYLSSETLQDSAALPFVLTVLGVGIVAFGMLYQRRRDRWRAALLAALPQGLARALPSGGDRAE